MLILLACVTTETQTLDDSLPASLSYDERAPEFSLPDVNASSITAGLDVGPGDVRGLVSAWYFGHAT